MATTLKILQDHLEWEVLPDVRITHLQFVDRIYSLPSSCIITFTRNTQYEIEAVISGVVKQSDDLKASFEQAEKGQLVTGETIIGYSPDGRYRFILHGALIGKINSTYTSVSPPAMSFTGALRVDKIEREFVAGSFSAVGASKQELHEWFLTGPSTMRFNRSTERSIAAQFTRVRSGIDQPKALPAANGSSSGVDYLLVKAADFSFLVTRVPESYEPGWSSSISIEYRQSLGLIPSETEREAIAELVSFVYGNQLLKIGETYYDSSCSMSLQVFLNPWGDNVVSRCQRPAYLPTATASYYDPNRAEITLNELITPFLEQYKTLRLSDSLWKYWIAKYSPLGINLPILSSAVETLAERVLKAHPEVKHYYIEPKEFQALIAEELASIQYKLATQEYIQPILNKIKGATYRGANEKLVMMFETINLSVGKVEKDAIKARNKMAHSSMGEVNDQEIEEALRYSRAYETLFNRIFLKLLGYEGDYIDYFTPGHPQRHISIPIPTP